MCHSAGPAGAMRKLLWPDFFLRGSLWWSTESLTAVSGLLPAFPPGVRWRKPGTPSSKPPPPQKNRTGPTDAASFFNHRVNCGKNDRVMIPHAQFTNYPFRGASEWVKSKAPTRPSLLPDKPSAASPGRRQVPAGTRPSPL